MGVILALLFVASTAHGSEPQERKIFNSYMKYSAQPTSPEAWGKAVGQQQTKIYQIQKGDTLWDVSKVLFGDPEFWPKIWSLNRNTIYNPHEILPRMSLSFSEGTLSAAPSLTLAPAEQPAATKNSSEDEPAEAATVIAPKPGYQDVPSNFPNLPVMSQKQAAEIPQMDYAKARTVEPYNLNFIIVARKLPLVGKVIETLHYSVAGTLGDQIDVESKTELGTGTYSFVRRLKSEKGYFVYQYLAEARVKEKMQGRTIMEITKTQAPVDEGCFMVEGEIPKVSMTATKDGAPGSRWDLFATPPQSQFEVAGRQSLFFLQGQDLEVGMKLKIVSTPENPKYRERVVGNGIVVQTDDHFATLLITDSITEIKKGDVAAAR